MPTCKYFPVFWNFHNFFALVFEVFSQLEGNRKYAQKELWVLMNNFAVMECKFAKMCHISDRDFDSILVAVVELPFLRIGLLFQPNFLN